MHLKPWPPWADARRSSRLALHEYGIAWHGGPADKQRIDKRVS